MKMPSPTLNSLGLHESAIPLYESLLKIHSKLHEIHAVRGGTTPNPEVISRRFTDSTVQGPPKSKGKKKRPVKVKSAAAQFHEVRRLLDERAFYPPHNQRKESSAYVSVHKQLVAKNGCLICGVTNDILKNPKSKIDLRLNPYAAKQLETHHHVIEWALANAIDPDKFNKFVFPHLKARHPDRYKNPLSPQEVKDWVDHSPDNLWVLCDVHHRAKWFGIHEITDPLWGPQDIFNGNFLARVREAIKTDARKRRK
jgi:hypothetical protein